MTTAPEMVIDPVDVADAAAKVRLPSCCAARHGLSVWVVDLEDSLDPFDWAVVVMHDLVCPVGGQSPRLRLVAAL